jgi:hypothetical protein
LIGWVGADICKVEIEGDEYSPFLLADSSDYEVRLALKLLIPDRECIVSAVVKKGGGFRREVLVDLESH